MAATDIPFTVSAKLSAAVAGYLESITSDKPQPMDFKYLMERADIAYQRELDLTEPSIKAKLAAARGDVTKLSNFQVPIVKPQVESALTYLVSTFLTGYPIFPVVADPANIDLARQYNALTTEHSVRGAWVRQLTLFFRDGLKYNLHGLRVTWDREKIYAPDVDPTSTVVRPKETIWEGNTLTRMDMYNTFFDPRCAPAEVHTKGDFVGYHEIKSKNQLKEFMDKLANASNKVDAFNSSFDSSLYYTPKINSRINSRQAEGGFDWDSWLVGKSSSNGTVNYSGSYVITHLYARIVPADFDMNVAARGQVQIWYFVLVNGKHCIYAERQTNLHRYLPIIIGQPSEDGLGVQTKPFAEDLIPFQDLSSGLWNSRLQAARRRISDRMFYNPKFVKKSDINSPEPTAKIPVSLPAYNSDIRAAVYQVPFEDTASATFAQEAGAIMEYSFFSSGQNRVQQGQFQKGNKSVHEFETVMGASNGRNHTMAILIESQVFTPLKEILKYNILQYQQDREVYDQDTKTNVQVKAADLRKQAIAFKISDGLIPTDKVISAEEFNVGLQTIAAVPALQQGYRLVQLFSYLMKVRGADGLEAFEKSEAELAYEQQLMSWERVANEAIKAGQQPPPQPEPPPELQQERQSRAETKQAISNPEQGGI